MTPVIVLQRDQTPNGIATPSPQVTEQTVRKMWEHILAAQSDLLIKLTADRITSNCASAADKLTAIWFWVKHRVKFLHDEVLTRTLFNESGHFELLIAPPVLIRMKAPSGDCDDFTMLVLALAMAAGFDCGIVTLVCDRRRPGEYSHVYGCALLEGVIVPLDCSHGRYPGWEVPRRDVQRKTIWDKSSKIVSDEQASTLDGMNGPAGGLGQVPPGLPSIPGMPAAFESGIPFIGEIDLQNPLELLTLGGAAASLLLATSATSKIVGAVGFMTARFLFQQMWGTW